MPRKQQIKDLNADDHQPATLGDLSLWGGRLQEQVIDIKEGQNRLETKMDRLETKVDKLETKVDKLELKVDKLDSKVGRIERSQESILDVVKSIDQQLREHKTHPDRLTRLEKSVFRR